MPNQDYSPKNVREHLARHRLSVNELELVIICRTCRFALGDSPTAVANHGVKRKSPAWLHDHVVSGLSLQSWGWHTAAGYWIVKPESSIALALDDSLLQDSVSQLSRLEALHRKERDRLLARHKASATDSDNADMALNTNWMRRTGWAKTFADADRSFLVKLAQMPQVAEHGLLLGK
jgi:hypothetical protein